MVDSALLWIAVLGYMLTWLLIPWVLLKRTVHASAAVAWILSIIFIPYLGALLCVLAGTTRWEVRTRRKQQATSHIDRRVPTWLREVPASNGQFGHWRPLARLVTSLTGSRVTLGNVVDVIPDTEESLDKITWMIEEAQDFVHIEFYIWRSDRVGDRIRNLLWRKARQGVEVRLLYDGFGSLGLGRSFLRTLRDAGVHVACFTPGPNFWHLLTLNLRNHRKIVIADGRIGMTGGMNIGQEYLLPTPAYGQWRDTQVLVQGPAVLPLQQVFAQDWYFATGEEIVGERYYPRPTVQGDVPVQIVADGPDDDVDALYSLLVAAAGQAEKSITLATPYFVPPEGVNIALQTAARRGVRVRILTAGRGNFIWTHQAGRSYYDGLLRAGVQIWEYQRGLYHAKTVVVDGEWCLVGTPNCDYRSFILNFEVALAMVDRQVARELEQQFLDDLQFAKRIEPSSWQRRPIVTRLHEQLWRLFAPLL